MFHIYSLKNITRLSGILHSKDFLRTVTSYSVKKLGCTNTDTCLTRSLACHRALTNNAQCSVVTTQRWFSNKTADLNQDKGGKQSDFVELYLFEKIRFLRLFGRFTKYSCYSFLIGVPTCVVSTYSSLLNPESAKVIIGVLTFYFAIFTGQSFLFTSRFLAKLMISSDEKLVKISHLSVFGNRKDIFVKPSEIVPFTDVAHKVFVRKMVLVRLKDSRKFIFMPDLGGIDTNYEALEVVLSGGLNENDEK